MGSGFEILYLCDIGKLNHSEPQFSHLKNEGNKNYSVHNRIILWDYCITYGKAGQDINHGPLVDHQAILGATA